MWDILYYILMFLEVVVCALLVLLVLMQRPRQDGLGAAFGGGTMDQAFGAQTTNVLQRGTVYLGIALFVLTFCLAVTVAHKNNVPVTGNSLVSDADKKVSAEAAVKAAADAAIAKTLAAKLETPAPAKAGEAKPDPGAATAPVKPTDTKPTTPPPAANPAPAPDAPKPADGK